MTDAINRKDLAEALKNHTSIATQKEAERVVCVLVETMLAGLSEGKRVNLRPLGAFEVKVRPARVARNPKTGAPVKLRARRVVKFIPSTTLKL